MAAGPAACVWRAEIGGVAVNMQHHATGVVADSGFRVRCTIIQEFDDRCGLFSRRMFLFRGNDIECHEHVPVLVVQVAPSAGQACIAVGHIRVGHAQ
eukprot:14561986-Ditylum_brightwellii.AAC.1